MSHSALGSREATGLILLLIQAMLLIHGLSLSVQSAKGAEAATKPATVPVIESLKAAVDHKEWKVRKEAAAVAGTLKSPAAVEVLVRLSRDENALVREQAARGLAGRDEPAARAALIRCLADVDLYVHKAALGGLGGSIERLPADLLMTCLDSPRGDVKRDALKQLGKLSLPPPDDRLIKLLQDGDPDVRLAVLSYMPHSRLLNRKLVSILIRLLEDRSNVVGRAIDLLKQIGDPIAVEGLRAVLDRTGDDSTRSAAMEALVALAGPKMTPVLVERLDDQKIRWTTLRLLGLAGDVSAQEAVLPLLDGQDTRNEVSAIDTLRKIGDQRAVPALCKRLLDGQPAVQLAAAKALAELGDQRAVGPLRQSLTHPKELVRAAALLALGRIGGPEATEALLQAVRDSNVEIRKAAVDGLAIVDDQRARTAVMAALDGPRTASSAAIVLGYWRDERAIEPLSRVVRSRWPDERFVERDVDGRETGGGLILGYYPRLEAVRALARIGTAQAVQALVPALNDPVKTVGWEAATALGELDCPQGRLALGEALVAHAELEVRIAAGTALCKLKCDGGYQPALEVMALDPRASLGEALSGLIDAERAARLIPWLKDSLPGRRRAAAVLLGLVRDKRALADVLALLEETDADMRCDAARAAGALGQKEALEPLCRLLDDASRRAAATTVWSQRQRELNLVRAAADGLGRLGDLRAIEPLTRALLNHRDEFQARRSLMDAIAHLGGPAALDTLIDHGLVNRYPVAAPLGSLGDKRAVDPLCRAFYRGWSSSAQNDLVAAVYALDRERGLELLERAVRLAGEHEGLELVKLAAEAGGPKARAILLRGTRKFGLEVCLFSREALERMDRAASQPAGGRKGADQ